MNRLYNYIRRLKVWRDCNGQDLVEYALGVGMVATAAVAAMPVFNSSLNEVISKIASIIDSSVQ
ncbi:MAG: Flp family type IVb pilin [Terriglobia bacterium]|nr:MAG: Flp family type IVb pilin [Terriglobia bacterium]